MNLGYELHNGPYNELGNVSLKQHSFYLIYFSTLFVDTISDLQFNDKIT